MKELNIGQVITRYRRQKGVTQEELASYMGVSKASVSKWETGQSYPDITFLPQLAAYFNISVDELIGYEPQMEAADIRETYRYFCRQFAHKPFEEVYEECQEMVKKYYACFPFLFLMAYLYLNHHMLADSSERQNEVLAEAGRLFQRGKIECQDPGLAKESEYGEATVLLMQNRPAEVLELLGEKIRPLMQDADLIAQAYLMLGNHQAAAQTKEIMLYQYLMGMLGQIPQLITAETSRPKKVEMLLDRALQLEKIFEADKLHPNSMALIYLAAAQFYIGAGEKEKTLEYLERYADMVGYFFPLELHGDSFFDRVEGWIEELELGNSAPRDAHLVKESIYQAVAENPLFAVLSGDERYEFIVKKIKGKLKMEENGHE